MLTRVHSSIASIQETATCHLISIHNIRFLLDLMTRLRDSIETGTTERFVRQFLREQFPSGDLPQWIVDAMNHVGIDLNATSTKCDVPIES
jgi:queuine tRNA-ribosyltransferase